MISIIMVLFTETNYVLMMVGFYKHIVESVRFHAWERKRVSKIHQLLIIILVYIYFNIVINVVINHRLI